MSVSTRLRFEIFKRDGFRCVYCGATPTTAVLRVDHVEPSSKGGTDDPSNLVTSCFDCNAGKSDVRLKDKRHAPTMDAEIVRDHADQLLGYLEAQRAVIAAKNSLHSEVAELWLNRFATEIPESVWNGLPRIVGEFALDKIDEAIGIVAGHRDLGSHRYWSATRDKDRAKYFFGILRKWREARERSADK